MSNHALDMRNRTSTFTTWNTTIYDVVIIGGGITGAGIARDAAERGLSVALVEAQDFATGTSSRSSKMIHGGLRYLPQGDIPLVREAASERQILRRIAPHLARKTQFVLPATSTAGIAKLRAGMWAFEKLGKVPAEDKHQVLNKKEFTEREPAANTDPFTGAVLYPEFLTNDARLTIANIRAAKAAGADVLNYARLTSFEMENGRAISARICSTLDGETLEANLRAKLFINAAGPWVDAIRTLEDEAQPPKLTLTKGIHIVVPHAAAPVNGTLIIRAPDKRSVFAVPRHGFTYIGTTDTFYEKTHYWPTSKPQTLTTFCNPPTKHCALILSPIRISPRFGPAPARSSVNRAKSHPTFPAKTKFGPAPAVCSSLRAANSPPIAKWPNASLTNALTHLG